MENTENAETTEKEKTETTGIAENKEIQEQTPSRKIESRSSQNDNVVFVGSKPLINYVKSISIQLNNSTEVIIKARGKFISKAVDIAEVAKRSKNPSISIKDIKTGTEEYEGKDREGKEKQIKVSTIDITVAK